MVTYPKDWIERTLQESCIPYGLVRGPFGGSLKKEMFKPNGNKVYEQRNAIYKSISIGEYYVDDEKYKEMERFSVHENDFIISCSGTIGRIYKIPSKAPKGIINQALLKITLNTDVCDSDYFYKYFEWDKFQSKIVDDTQGGAMKNLVGMDKFRNTKIFMPQDINEQKAIAATLSTFDTHIDNLTALIEKKKAIRDGALVDLMSGRTRLEGFSGEWEEYPLEYFALIINGDRGEKYPSGTDFKQHGIPFINAGHLKNGTVSWGEMDYISNEHYNNLGGGKIKKGDILFCLRGSLGKYAMVDFDEGAPASSLCIIRANNNTDAKFLMYIVGSDETKSHIANVTTGSSQPNLSAKDVSKFNYKIPVDIDEQKAIADILTSMDTEIQNLETERDKFIQIREGAMDDLLTGRVRLPM